jgi:hypothetical protein
MFNIHLRVSVNVKPCKFILCYVKQCKCKCKNKYIYMVLSESHVQIRWGSILFSTIKKSDFYLGNGDFGDKPTKMPIAKKNQS